MTNSNGSYVDSKMAKNGKSNTTIPEEMGEKRNVEKDNIDEIEVMAEMTGDKAKPDHSSNLDEYDPSLDILIALRKGTRSCPNSPSVTMFPMRTYHSSEPLQPVLTLP